MFAPTVLAHGSATSGRRLHLDTTTGEVHPGGGYARFRDDPTAGAIYRFRDRLVLADVDTRAEYRSVQSLIAEREAETGRPAHVAWMTGGVMDDGADRLAVAVAEPDPAWRRWFIEELHRAHPRTARWGHQYTRAPGTINIKHARLPDGHLYELLAAGPRRISLEDARSRVRDRAAAWRRLHQPAPDGTGESAGIPPYETRYGGRFDTGRSTAGYGAHHRTSGHGDVDVPTLLGYLPPWAHAAARLDLPQGERSGPELAVCRGAALVGLTPVDLHRILSVVPAGGRWRADRRTVATAAQRLRAAERWLAAHPGTGARVVAPEARDAALAAWDAVLLDAARAGLPATRWAVLLRHRVLAVEDAGGSWLGSVRDLAMGVDRSLLEAARVDLARWVVRVRAGSGGRGREAAVWALAEPFRESAGIPHESGGLAAALRAWADAAAALMEGDLWAPAHRGPRSDEDASDRRAADASDALVLAAVTVGLPLDDLRRMVRVGERAFRGWTSSAAALGLIVRDGQRSLWRVGEDVNVVADRLGVTGRAGAHAAVIAHERAVADEVDALAAAGDGAAIGELRFRERARTAVAAGRPVNPGRRGARPGDNDVVVLFEDERLGVQAGLTQRDLREGAAALLSGWEARWARWARSGAERRAVAAEVAAWRPGKLAPTPVRSFPRPVSDEDALADDGDSCWDPLAVVEPGGEDVPWLMAA